MNQDLYTLVDKWVEENRNDLVENIIELVKIPSISDEDATQKPFGTACREVIAKMIEIAERYGFSTKNYEDYCMSAWIDGQEDDVGNCIGIWGHLDVVPAGDNWINSPFDPVERDGFLIGRGVEDNKGPAVASMFALRCLHELGVKLQHQLRIFTGGNEECGMKDVTYYTEKYTCPKLSLVADGGFPVGFAEKGILEVDLIGDQVFSEDIISLSGGLVSNMVPDSAEIIMKCSDKTMHAKKFLPPDFQIEESHNLVIRAKGISRHSASPQGGMNAITKLVHGLLYSGILSEEDEAAILFLTQVNLGFSGRGLDIICSDEISGELTCVGSIISLDEMRRPVLHVNIRYPVTKDQDELIHSMEEAGKKKDFHIHVRRASAPNLFPKEHPVVTTLTRVYNEITDNTEAPYSMSGGTYARKLPNALIFGMGMPSDSNAIEKLQLPDGHGGGHAPDEALNINSLLQAVKIYCMALAEIDKLEL